VDFLTPRAILNPNDGVREGDVVNILGNFPLADDLNTVTFTLEGPDDINRPLFFLDDHDDDGILNYEDSDLPGWDDTTPADGFHDPYVVAYSTNWFALNAGVPRLEDNTHADWVDDNGNDIDDVAESILPLYYLGDHDDDGILNYEDSDLPDWDDTTPADGFHDPFVDAYSTNWFALNAGIPRLEDTTNGGWADADGNGIDDDADDLREPSAVLWKGRADVNQTANHYFMQFTAPSIAGEYEFTLKACNNCTQCIETNQTVTVVCKHQRDVDSIVPLHQAQAQVEDDSVTFGKEGWPCVHLHGDASDLNEDEKDDFTYEWYVLSVVPAIEGDVSAFHPISNFDPADLKEGTPTPGAAVTTYYPSSEGPFKGGKVEKTVTPQTRDDVQVNTWTTQTVKLTGLYNEHHTHYLPYALGDDDGDGTLNFEDDDLDLSTSNPTCTFSTVGLAGRPNRWNCYQSLATTPNSILGNAGGKYLYEQGTWAGDAFVDADQNGIHDAIDAAGDADISYNNQAAETQKVAIATHALGAHAAVETHVHGLAHHDHSTYNVDEWNMFPTSFHPDIAGVYTLELRITDNACGLTSKSQVTVTAACAPQPTAQIFAPKTLSMGQEEAVVLTLVGSAGTLPNIWPDYHWAYAPGSDDTLPDIENAETKYASVLIEAPGTYHFTLQVDDGCSKSEVVTHTVVVDRACTTLVDDTQVAETFAPYNYLNPSLTESFCLQVASSDSGPASATKNTLDSESDLPEDFYEDYGGLMCDPVYEWKLESYNPEHLTLPPFDPCSEDDRDLDICELYRANVKVEERRGMLNSERAEVGDNLVEEASTAAPKAEETPVTQQGWFVVLMILLALFIVVGLVLMLRKGNNPEKYANAEAE
jgi:hypothetical protein